eukprot:PRCOL_00006683-RA
MHFDRRAVRRPPAAAEAPSATDVAAADAQREAAAALDALGAADAALAALGVDGAGRGRRPTGGLKPTGSIRPPRPLDDLIRYSAAEKMKALPFDDGTGDDEMHPQLKRQPLTAEGAKSAFWDWAPAESEAAEPAFLDIAFESAVLAPSATSSTDAGLPGWESDQRDATPDAGWESSDEEDAGADTSDVQTVAGAPSYLVLKATTAKVDDSAKTDALDAETLAHKKESEVARLAEKKVSEVARAVAEAAIAAAVPDSGIEVCAKTADGTTTWTSRGTEDVGDGRLRRWTRVRGAAADGSTEWEERWWETSDRFGYRELGAAKEGRDSKGTVWAESWTEAIDEAAGGLTAVQRSADKRGADADGAEWHERWGEYYEDGGVADKWADKWSKVAPGAYVAPGHGSYWHERWGERYETGGEILKWTDRWAERQAEGSSWGDKWEENHAAGGGGWKRGETWKKWADGGQWVQQWAEESAFGGVRKYGGNSDGHNWDSFEDGALWVSGNHFNYDMALSHSPYLLSVKLRGEYELEQMAAPTQAAKDAPTSGALGSVAMFGAAGPPEGAD